MAAFLHPTIHTQGNKKMYKMEIRLFTVNTKCERGNNQTMLMHVMHVISKSDDRSSELTEGHLRVIVLSNQRILIKH